MSIFGKLIVVSADIILLDKVMSRVIERLSLRPTKTTMFLVGLLFAIVLILLGLMGYWIIGSLIGTLG